MANILVAVDHDGLPLVFNDALRTELNQLGRVTWRSDLTGADAATYAQAIRDAQAEIVLTFWGSPKVTREVLAANPQLKYLCHIAGTVRKLVERECLAAGLIVTNWGKVISRICAEAALMMILASLRRAGAVTLDMHVRRLWPKDAGYQPRSLFERTVGLHGMGVIAQELVALLRPFKVRLSGYSPHAPQEVFDSLGVRRVDDLKTLYATNEIVSIHTGNTPENFHCVNAEVLAGMPDDAVLVNTARGAIIDTAALVSELRTGRLNAALDVYEDEPLPPDSPLRGLPNCLLWPHWGCPTNDRIIDCGKHAVQNVARYLRGEPPVDRLTAERFDTMT
jgi:phosphoglycerate dehydrogenase-like enzyme